MQSFESLNQVTPSPALDAKDKHARKLRKESNAIYRANRKARVRECIEIHHDAVAAEKARLKAKGKAFTNLEIGFTKRRVLRDKKNPKVINLPLEFATILKGCEEFIDNPSRFPALDIWVSEMRNRQARELVAKVLACLLSNTDMISGRVGKPTEAGMKTLSYYQLQEDYALRFGEYIAPKSFGKAIKYLKQAGYFHSEAINIRMEDGEGAVRSAPAYKQFSERFFSDLKVVRYSNVAESIVATRKRQMKEGLRHTWVSFREIANGVRQIFLNANKFESIAESTGRVFEAYLPLHPNPH
ncbi:hypothetical protein [Vibrio campbellii]|uniref:Uncharacterized protein n=1 Tax=Vibrio campbellii (strain ATCC BAA-1116) TaxID=2902295 RepID=A7N8Z9_VIBC1|nr:hypothetical protein [Vibrio campbellii]ABU75071.1 hypothetical protein VIBHAR_p08224 [Vibrio campbellii ATCC BAA-1116]AGU99077.1 hypothetical protein M892_28550 [Vibrio campbellii ATCC BAA-1116]